MLGTWPRSSESKSWKTDGKESDEQDMCVVEQDGGGASQAQGVALQRNKDSAKLITFRAQKQLETQPEAVQDQT